MSDLSGRHRNQEERIDAVLRRNGATAHVHGGGRTPLEDLFRMEEGLEVDELEIRREERVETYRRVMGYIFEEGPEPLRVLRRIFAVVKATNPELLGDMSLEDISIICADAGKATVSARIQRVYSKKVEEAGGSGAAPFQKRSEKYGESQVGNRNRRKGKRRRRGKKEGK